MARLRAAEYDSDSSLPEVGRLIGRRTSPQKKLSQRGAVGPSDQTESRKRLQAPQTIQDQEVPTTLTSQVVNARAKPSPIKASFKLQRPLGSTAPNPLLVPITIEDFDKKKTKPSAGKETDSNQQDVGAGKFSQPTEPRTPKRLAKGKVNYTLSLADSPTLSDGRDSLESFVSEDGLSDFVVNDSASETELRLPPRSHRKPKNTEARKLVRARRKVLLDDEDEGSEKDGESTPKPQEGTSREVLDAFRKLSLGEGKPEREVEVPPVADFPKLEPGAILQYSLPPKRSPTKTSLDPTQFTTPPASPSKPRLQSPTKCLTRIPQSPHKSHIDAFWTQDIINDWNDQYSPRKTLESRNRFPLLWRDSSEDAELSPSESSPRKSRSPCRSPSKKKKAAQAASKRSWDDRKEQLARDFLAELDRKVTNGQLAALSASTGGIQLVWSKTLNTTAGRARWKREAIRAVTADQKAAATTTYKHHASLDLSVKILTSAERLTNVLAHEFCHLANFMVSNVRDQPHGASFKSWAKKVMDAFTDRGIVVTTKHSYEIDFKYVWVCEACGVEYKRHSKSINTERCRCGIGGCRGRLVQVKPMPRGGKGNNEKKIDGNGKDGGNTEKGGGKYQAFVKERYKEVKRENPGWRMGEVMAEVARRYKAEKEREKENVVSDLKEVTRKTVMLAVEDESDVVVVDGDKFVVDEEQEELEYTKKSKAATDRDEKVNRAQVMERRLQTLRLSE